MHYNPFAYIHSEKDILKLVTVLISNTKGEGKGGDDFWVKAETLLYIALIGYIHYELPPEEQNFATLIDMLNKMGDVRVSKTDLTGSDYLPHTLIEVKSADGQTVLKDYTGDDGYLPAE